MQSSIKALSVAMKLVCSNYGNWVLELPTIKIQQKTDLQSYLTLMAKQYCMPEQLKSSHRIAIVDIRNITLNTSNFGHKIPTKSFQIDEIAVKIRNTHRRRKEAPRKRKIKIEIMYRFQWSIDKQHIMDRMAQTTLQPRIDNFICPISCQLMSIPYKLKDCGHVFEFDSIWKNMNDYESSICPLCRRAIRDGQIDGQLVELISEIVLKPHALVEQLHQKGSDNTLLKRVQADEGAQK